MFDDFGLPIIGSALENKPEIPERLKAIRGFLFDVDGTLMNVEERFFYHYNLNLEAFGISPVARENYEYMRARGILSQPIPDEGNNRADFWLKFIEDFSYSDHPELGCPFPGTVETLEWLKNRGYRMAVITGRTSIADRVGEELELHGIAEHFEFVLTNRDGVRGMNKAENLVRGGRLFGLEPSECAYVGDWQGDVESAAEAGIGLVIAVLTGGESRQALEKFNPDVILESIADIPGFLESFRSGEAPR